MTITQIKFWRTYYSYLLILRYKMCILRYKMCILRLTIVIDNITFLTKHHNKIKYNNICYIHLETIYYYNTVIPIYTFGYIYELWPRCAAENIIFVKILINNILYVCFHENV